MADTEQLPRSQRRAGRSSRRGRLGRVAATIGGLFVVLGAVGAALVLANVITVPGSDDTHLNAAARRVTASSTPTTRPRTVARRRALTPADPLRLWIAGDSLAGSIGPSLGELTANTGVVQPQYDSRVSSGLLTPDFYDWPKHAEQQLALLNPEVVVFIVGTNDANVWSAKLADEYRIRTEAMMRELVGTKHRDVYWVGAPVAQAKQLESGVIEVNRIQRAAAAAVPGVTYVDAHAIFDDTNGDYQTRFADQFGRTQIMRAGDGVHFSVAGADLISADIFGLINAEWKITSQAVPGAPKPVLETKGSTQIPGTHKSVGASVSDGAPTSRPANKAPSATSTSSSSTTSTTSVSSTTTSSSASSTTTTSSTPAPSTP